MPKKRIVIGSIVAVIVCAELCSWLALTLIDREPARYGMLPDAIEDMYTSQGISVTLNDGVQQFRQNEVMHPYLGYVLQADRSLGEHAQFGFGDSTSPKLTQQTGSIVIGIFGGSFAQQLDTYARDVLRTSLQEYPLFQGKHLIIMPVALGGYKQPQQLFALLYFLLTGARFDIVLNIDGFNEVALDPAERAQKGISHLYPRGWYERSLRFAGDIEFTALAGEITYLRRKRAQYAQMLIHTPLRYSFAALLPWRVTDALLKKKIANRRIAIFTRSPRTPIADNAAGPLPIEFSSLQEEHAARVALWEQGSKLLHQISAAFGMEYLHVLQPNQYVDGTKPLSSEEKRTAYDPDNMYKPHVQSMYPLLRASGKRLKESGIAFYDFVDIFRDVPDTLYSDTCCHLNTEGYEYVARILAPLIAKQYRRHQE